MKQSTLFNDPAPVNYREQVEELLKKAALLCKEELRELGQKITCPTDLVDLCRTEIGFKTDKEAMMVFYTDARNKILHYEIVVEGTVNHVVIYVREIIKTALNKNASGIIIAHNHPSGECNPSAADIRLTENINKACQAIELQLLDHLVISRDEHLSFREENLI